MRAKKLKSVMFLLTIRVGMNRVVNGVAAVRLTCKCAVVAGTQAVREGEIMAEQLY